MFFQFSGNSMIILFSAVFILRLLWNTIVPDWVKRVCLAVVHLLSMLFQVRIHGLRHLGKRYSVIDSFESNVDKSPDLVQLICVEDDQKVTLKELDFIANRLAHWAIEVGLKSRSAVPILVSFYPLYIFHMCVS